MTTLMPKATAIWLIDNTALTFEQIADFCALHRLEVQGIADGEVVETMRGADPVASGELTREEIRKGEADPSARLAHPEKHGGDVPAVTQRRKTRYTPISRRNNRPDAIAWFLRNHSEIPQAAIIRLIGTTRTMIEAVRTRSHWNSANIKPVDPVTLGLCTQTELDALVEKASRNLSKTPEADDDAAGNAAPRLTPLSSASSSAVSPGPESSSPRPGGGKMDAEKHFTSPASPTNEQVSEPS